MPNNAFATELLIPVRLSVKLVIEVGCVCMVGFYTHNRQKCGRYVAETLVLHSIVYPATDVSDGVSTNILASGVSRLQAMAFHGLRYRRLRGSGVAARCIKVSG